MTDTPLGWTPADIHADEIAFRLELMRSEKGVGQSAFADLLRRIADDYADECAAEAPAIAGRNGLAACLMCMCVFGGIGILAVAALVGVLTGK